MIDVWWKSFKNSNLYGNYSIQKIGNKYYVIIDDFSHMPHQHSISFERDDLDKLPKHLGGVCWTDYRSINGKKSVIVNMYFEDKDFYIHNYNDVITISGLFKIVNGSIYYLSKEDFNSFISCLEFQIREFYKEKREKENENKNTDKKG